jgi:hypothetical protein
MEKSMLTAALLLAMALVAMALVAALPALAQEEFVQEEELETGLDNGPPDLGTITSISGDTILVEEDPIVSFSDGSPLLPGADKGYFTLTGETEIFRLLGEDAVVPASFDDLEIGQLVAPRTREISLPRLIPHKG